MRRLLVVPCTGCSRVGFLTTRSYFAKPTTVNPYLLRIGENRCQPCLEGGLSSHTSLFSHHFTRNHRRHEAGRRRQKRPTTLSRLHSSPHGNTGFPGAFPRPYRRWFSAPESSLVRIKRILRIVSNAVLRPSASGLERFHKGCKAKKEHRSGTVC